MPPGSGAFPLTRCRRVFTIVVPGRIAQLGERVPRTDEAEGSNPFPSTSFLYGVWCPQWPDAVCFPLSVYDLSTTEPPSVPNPLSLRPPFNKFAGEPGAPEVEHTEAGRLAGERGTT